MNVTVVRPRDLGQPEVAAWRDMQRQNVEFDNAFLSPGFAVAVDRARSDARVAIIQEAGQTVGFFAFQQGRSHVARPIGAGICDRQAVVHAPHCDLNIGALLAASGISVWEFDHLVGRQLERAGGRTRAVSSPIIDVSQGYERYLAERQRASKKIVKSTLAKHRRMEREVGPTRFDFEARDRDAFELMILWKSAQYRRTGRRDRFAVKWIEYVVRDLFEQPAEGCIGTLSVLRAAEKVAALHFGLRADSTLSCWFPAYRPELARYSPGLLLHLKMAEGAAASGLRQLDLGKGGEEYKQSLKTGDLVVGEGWVDRPSAVALARRIALAPRRLAYRLVERSPVLRQMARRTLLGIGRLRRSA
jgi:CelD/BcsL family acetyltransferase involved in cellulose biosynthesis